MISKLRHDPVRLPPLPGKELHQDKLINDTGEPVRCQPCVGEDLGLVGLDDDVGVKLAQLDEIHACLWRRFGVEVNYNIAAGRLEQHRLSDERASAWCNQIRWASATLVDHAEPIVVTIQGVQLGP